jgi:hypothetical protein
VRRERLLLPSIWPETFSYVAEELMQLGVPLAVFDLERRRSGSRTTHRACASSVSMPPSRSSGSWHFTRRCRPRRSRGPGRATADSPP